MGIGGALVGHADAGERKKFLVTRRGVRPTLKCGGHSIFCLMEQQIHFCTTDDHVRIAYAIAGNGPPLVKAATWLSHLEFDWVSPIWRHMLAEFARDHSFIRYDERG